MESQGQRVWALFWITQLVQEEEEEEEDKDFGSLHSPHTVAHSPS